MEGVAARETSPHSIIIMTRFGLITARRQRQGGSASITMISEHHHNTVHRSSTATKQVQHYDIIWTLRTSEQPDAIAIDYTPLVDGNKAGTAV